MSLIVEDGTGLSNAESYASVSDADTYHSAMGNTSWSVLTTANKELALRLATKYLDRKYGARWVGVSTNEEQALDWPMYGVLSRAGFLIDQDSIPTKLKEATMEAALRSSTEDLMPDIEIDSSAGLTGERIKVGPIEIESKFGSSQSTFKTYVEVNSILESAGYILPAGAANRG